MALASRILSFWRETTQAIQDAQKPVRVLRALSWEPQVARDFFATRARELPRPVYRVGLDAPAVVARFAEIRSKLTGENEMERLLRATCDSYVGAARLLAAVGTREFHALSCELYGRPRTMLRDGKTTNLALAR